MIGELNPVRVDPVTADADFWRRFHELRRIRHEETRPDDPLEPDSMVEALLKRHDPYDLVERYEITRDGVMLSSFRGSTVTPASPEYATNKHLYWADIYVRPEHRRGRIASTWLPLLVRLMGGHGCTVVGIGAELDSGHAFLRWSGFEPKLSDIENRLRLQDVDWAMLERWVQEGQARSPQTRLEIYDGEIPEEMRPEYARQRSALLNTIPFENLDLGEIVMTPELMREWYARMALKGEISHDVLTREPDGTFSGMTDVTWAPYRRTLIEQQFTGVLPATRGRGIGKWIKAAMLLHIRELYPDAEWVVTGNAQSNGPMLAINRAMGFRQYRTSTDYQTTRDQLEARIRSL